MARIVAIDFGLKRIGIAISDEGKKIAFPLQTIPGGKNAIAEIRKTLADKKVELILIGLPLLLSGKEGEMAAVVTAFAKELQETLQIPVQLIDERLSSRAADQRLREIHLNRKERNEKMDMMAAALLLQTYLDGIKSS